MTTRPTTRPQTPHNRLRTAAGMHAHTAAGRRAHTAAGMHATTATGRRAHTPAGMGAAAGAGPHNSFAQRRPTQETP